MSPATTSMLSTIHTWTTIAPLMAAVFAPFSILFDIPALTEPWFIHTDPSVLLDPNASNAVPDRTASIVLSAVGLGFNICANALLIVRFSTSAQWWRVATRLSILFWVSKVIIALVNLCVFGPSKDGTQRGEGLWCAVVSLIICFLITFLLLCHWIFEFTKDRREKGPTDQQLEVRIAGRHFMLNVTFFVFDLGLLALIASRVEHWTYLQGMYFATITYLTIGFGDFYPTHTVTRILLFFFAVIGIAQLGNIVGMLVGFFSSRADEKRAASRAEYERERQEEMESQPGMTPDLQQEIDFLHTLWQKQEERTRAGQLGKSLFGLIVFWVVGAAIFSQLEGFAYGTGLYFCYVSFLTIGYGEFAPITPAGRVVFVLYSLVAVPIMASFAVQAVQQIFSALSTRQYDKTKAKKGLEPYSNTQTSRPRSKHGRSHDTENAEGSQSSSQNRIVPHAELAEKWHRDWEKQVRKHREEGLSEGDAKQLADRETEMAKGQEKEREKKATASGELDAKSDSTPEPATQEEEREFNEDARLTERVLELALSLEQRARKLLIMSLDTGDESGGVRGGKAARLVLKADRNVQLREVRGLLKEIEEEEAARNQDENEADGKLAGADAEKSHPVPEGARSGTILKHILQDDPDVMEFPSQKDEHEVSEEVRRYREDFAGLLAAGSRLMGLKGNERALFERRRLQKRHEHQSED